MAKQGERQSLIAPGESSTEIAPPELASEMSVPTPSNKVSEPVSLAPETIIETATLIPEAPGSAATLTTAMPSVQKQEETEETMTPSASLPAGPEKVESSLPVTTKALRPQSPPMDVTKNLHTISASDPVVMGVGAGKPDTFLNDPAVHLPSKDTDNQLSLSVPKPALQVKASMEANLAEETSTSDSEAETEIDPEEHIDSDNNGLKRLNWARMRSHLHGQRDRRDSFGGASDSFGSTVADLPSSPLYRQLDFSDDETDDNKPLLSRSPDDHEAVSSEPRNFAAKAGNESKNLKPSPLGSTSTPYTPPQPRSQTARDAPKTAVTHASRPIISTGAASLPVPSPPSIAGRRPFNPVQPPVNDPAASLAAMQATIERLQKEKKQAKKATKVQETVEEKAERMTELNRHTKRVSKRTLKVSCSHSSPASIAGPATTATVPYRAPTAVMTNSATPAVIPYRAPTAVMTTPATTATVTNGTAPSIGRYPAAFTNLSDDEVCRRLKQLGYTEDGELNEMTERMVQFQKWNTNTFQYAPADINNYLRGPVPSMTGTQDKSQKPVDADNPFEYMPKSFSKEPASGAPSHESEVPSYSWLPLQPRAMPEGFYEAEEEKKRGIGPRASKLDVHKNIVAEAAKVEGSLPELQVAVHSMIHRPVVPLSAALYRGEHEVKVKPSPYSETCLKAIKKRQQRKARKQAKRKGLDPAGAAATAASRGIAAAADSSSAVSGASSSSRPSASDATATIADNSNDTVLNPDSPDDSVFCRLGVESGLSSFVGSGSITLGDANLSRVTVYEGKIVQEHEAGHCRFVTVVGEDEVVFPIPDEAVDLAIEQRDQPDAIVYVLPTEVDLARKEVTYIIKLLPENIPAQDAAPPAQPNGEGSGVEATPADFKEFMELSKAEAKMQVEARVGAVLRGEIADECVPVKWAETGQQSKSEIKNENEDENGCKTSTSTSTTTKAETEAKPEPPSRPELGTERPIPVTVPDPEYEFTFPAELYIEEFLRSQPAQLVVERPYANPHPVLKKMREYTIDDDFADRHKYWEGRILELLDDPVRRKEARTKVLILSKRRTDRVEPVELWTQAYRMLLVLDAEAEAKAEAETDAEVEAEAETEAKDEAETEESEEIEGHGSDGSDGSGLFVSETSS